MPTFCSTCCTGVGEQYAVYTLSFTPGLTDVTTTHDIDAWALCGLKMKFSRLTPIQKRQNYWANTIILDGRYPALFWEYDILVTRIETSTCSFIQDFLNFAVPPFVTSAPQPLMLRRAVVDTVQDVIFFGNCYLDTSDLAKPDMGFLYSSAGMVNFKFWGTTIPTMVSTLWP